MQDILYARLTGDVKPHVFSRNITNQLLQNFASSPHHRFDGNDENDGVDTSTASQVWAHRIGINAIALDKFDGRHLLSGGSDGLIKLWNLDDCGNPHRAHTFQPRKQSPRLVDEDSDDEVDGNACIPHARGITHLDFYPLGPDTFLSSSYDKSLKWWSAEEMRVMQSYDLGDLVYSHATSPRRSHLIVACATRNPHVRLVDLRSRNPLTALASQSGPVLSVAWSPRQDNILASGHSDGRTRIWDIRRSDATIGMLDQEDSLGLLHHIDHARAAGIPWDTSKPRIRHAARAHDDVVNGLTWTQDGKYIVSAGLDRRVHVWNAATGANTLASFGSVIQNQTLNGAMKTATVLVSPSNLTRGKRELLIWPNETEILILDLHEGTLLSRLRVPAPKLAPTSGLNTKSRIVGMVWRGAGGLGQLQGDIMGGGSSFGALYTAHTDGQIRAWMPRLPGPDLDDPGDESEDREDENTKKRKRKVIDDAYRSLTGRQVTFT